MPFHSKLTGDEVHVVYAFTYADSTARIGATGLTADDVGKAARQLSNNSFWILVNHSPVTWVEISNTTLGPHALQHLPGGNDAVALATTSTAGLLSAADKQAIDTFASGSVAISVRNETGATLLRGKLVAAVGFSTVEGVVLVDLADKDTPALRPALGMLMADLSNNANGAALVTGKFTGLNTAAFAITDQLVLGNAGAFVRPPPDNSPFTGEVQNIASVTRAHATLGEISLDVDGLNAVTGSQTFALQGTEGTPSDTNRYVTDEDPRLNYGLSTILYVDSATVGGDGSIAQPFTTVQDAIDVAALTPSVQWMIEVSADTYSENLTIPENLDLTFVSNWRGVSVLSGNITWTVTGNFTSRLGFRHFSVEGALTIVDGTSPAVNAIVTTEWSQIGATAGGVAITATGTSFVTAAFVGASEASFSTATSIVVQNVVAGDVLLPNSVVFVSNAQFRSTCTLIRGGKLFISGSAFEQDIECTGDTAEFKDCTWASPANSLTFTGAAGTALVDDTSLHTFVEQGTTIVNGVLKAIAGDSPSTGYVSGGVVTRAGGRDLSVTAGSGVVAVTTNGNTITRLFWGSTTVTAPASSSFVVYVDDQNVVNVDATEDGVQYVILARGLTDATNVLVLTDYQVYARQQAAFTNLYRRDVIGPIVVSGLAASALPSNQVAVDSGTFYIDSVLLSAAATSPITFRYWYRDGLGGWTTVASQTAISSANYDDGSGTLAAIPALQFKKDLLFVGVNNGTTEYHVVYGQETFADQGAAEAGNSPAPNSDLLRNSLRVAGVVIQSGASSIASVVDAKPRLGQQATGTTAVTDHGLLSGLADNDHPQYQLTSQKNAASGYAGLDGSTKLAVAQIPNHASTHNPGGTDALATGTPSTIGDTNAEGTASALARQDHTHRGRYLQSVFAEISVDTTTTSTTYVTLISQNITTTGTSNIQIRFDASASADTNARQISFRLTIDSVVRRGAALFVKDATFVASTSLTYKLAGLSAGVHTVLIEWLTSGGTARIRPATVVEEHASLLIVEAAS